MRHCHSYLTYMAILLHELLQFVWFCIIAFIFRLRRQNGADDVAAV